MEKLSPIAKSKKMCKVNLNKVRGSKKSRLLNKKAQGATTGMPFGMIFSMFLIAVFVFVAFVAVKGFLRTDEAANAGIFYEELQSAVNDVMRSQSSSFEFNVKLPGKITHLCFANLTMPISNNGPEYDDIKYYDIYDSNTFLIPTKNAGDFDRKKIENINLQEIIKDKNPYCVRTNQKLTLSKEFYDKSVMIE